MALLLLLFLDLAGFTLIFPLVPALLEYYTGQADWIKKLYRDTSNLLLSEETPSELAVVFIGGILGSIYSLLQFIAAPIWGKLSDRWGRRPVLVLTSLGLALSYFLWYFSTDFLFFCISRLLGGLMAGNMGVASAAMADMTPPEKRTRAMGLIGATFGMGFIFGPVLGGLAVHLPLPEKLYLHPFCGPALLAAILSLCSALFNLLLFRETLWQKIKKRGSSYWIGNPLRSLRQSDNSLFRQLIFVNFIYIFAFACYEFTFTFFYRFKFHLDPTEIGFLFLYLGIWLILGQGVLVRILSKYVGERRLLLSGLLLTAPSLLLLGFTPPYLLLSLLILVPISLGAALIQPSLTSLISLTALPARLGSALGAARSAGSLGRAVAPLVAAQLYWLWGARITYAAISFFMLLILLYLLNLTGLRRLSGRGCQAEIDR